MERIRLLLVLIISISTGGSLAYATYTYFEAPVPVPAVMSVRTAPVAVAAVDVPPGTPLRAETVRLVAWPATALPAGAFQSVDELQGRVVLTSLVADEPILAGKLAPVGSGAGLPPIIPPGMRAVSVPVNEVIGVAGYVLPGSRVDVLATTSPSGRPEDTTTKVVLTNVQVLAAGTRLEQQQEGEPMQISVATLLVTPEQAERLTLAVTEGKIHLALRNPLDAGAPQTPGVQPALLVGRPPSDPPARRQTTKAASTPAVRMVDMIRGEKRDREAVK